MTRKTRRRPDPDVWRLGQLSRTDLVIEYLAACTRPDGTGSRGTRQAAVPDMANKDMITAILDKRDEAGTARVKAAAERAWQIHHGAKQRITA